ncbi:metallophosphoesterase family protein [Actinokineospora soli]|uniref:Metallophosphoesterase family protein n=1 Tax=Actinokineospora soli TaxID=1048753 RepID=A0ABW2TJ03_9PSEU
MAAGSTQETWLRNDLRNSTKPCTAAYWHHPLFTRGTHSNSTQVRPLWQALYDFKADLILVGHDHNYQRYAPQDPTGKADPNGIRQLLVGTGGKSMYGFSRDMPNVETSQTGTHGVLKLSLTATGYTGDFVPVEGRTWSDNFSATCKPKGTGGGETVWSDDFETAKGWTTNPAGTDTATTGAFERGDPETTTDSSQTKQLGTAASGVNCLVTGRLAGSSAGTYDVDAGVTSARSPQITLPSTGRLTLTTKWSTGFGANATSEDYLKVTVVGSGGQVVVLDQRGSGAHSAGSWRTATADISALAGQTVRVHVEAADPGTASLVEAQIDDVLITKA